MNTRVNSFPASGAISFSDLRRVIQGSYSEGSYAQTNINDTLLRQQKCTSSLVSTRPASGSQTSLGDFRGKVVKMIPGSWSYFNSSFDRNTYNNTGVTWTAIGGSLSFSSTNRWSTANCPENFYSTSLSCPAQTGPSTASSLGYTDTSDRYFDLRDTSRGSYVYFGAWVYPTTANTFNLGGYYGVEGWNWTADGLQWALQRMSDTSIRLVYKGPTIGTPIIIQSGTGIAPLNTWTYIGAYGENGASVGLHAWSLGGTSPSYDSGFSSTLMYNLTSATRTFRLGYVSSGTSGACLVNDLTCCNSLTQQTYTTSSLTPATTRLDCPQITFL